MEADVTRRALVTRGGWDGHHPVEATELFIPFLEAQGYEVRVDETPEVYADAEAMASFDVLVQSITMSTATREQIDGLRDAVRAGLGLTGWHGGIADSFRNSSDYLQLVGGQFATHPSKHPDEVVGDETDNFLPYTIAFTEAGRAHPITAGIPDFDLTTEQYWVLHDDLNDVLATTTHPAPPWHPWHRTITSPAVWTRSWGAGRIAVSTPGHSIDVLQHPHVRTIIERSIQWVSRTASAS
jgi:uncharacterized protein